MTQLIDMGSVAIAQLDLVLGIFLLFLNFLAPLRLCVSFIQGI
ncbi:MAG: hypothetical protein SAK29_42280 [Scytonema sp. PMC 1069.18]|nr:hypothetical protein [Scytonema sp. PMC 1069.18]MEC4882227.1 hypothetical protein [Scytonema sp. PMC 1070.18]